MVPFISNTFNLPVTRAEILERAKWYRDLGLCYALHRALTVYNLNDTLYKDIFLKFNFDNAIKFGASKHAYWWPSGLWSSGRMDFLNWLIEEYKDDKTNLRNAYGNPPKIDSGVFKYLVLLFFTYILLLLLLLTWLWYEQALILAEILYLKKQERGHGLLRVTCNSVIGGIGIRNHRYLK